jgi:hypothetical protein
MNQMTVESATPRSHAVWTGKPRIVRHGSDARRIFALRIVHLLAVVGTLDRSLERALVFLSVFVLAHHAASVG